MADHSHVTVGLCGASISSRDQCHERARHGALPPSGRDEHGSTQVPTVSARHLHAFLEVGKHFRTWIQDRIAAFGFVEGQDYVIFENEFRPDLGETYGGRPAKEYHLTIDMAKELSMVERNEKGKQARRYFIECEKRMVEGTAAPPSATSTLPKAWALTALATFARSSPDIRLTYWNLEFAPPWRKFTRALEGPPLSTGSTSSRRCSSRLSQTTRAAPPAPQLVRPLHRSPTKPIRLWWSLQAV